MTVGPLGHSTPVAEPSNHRTAFDQTETIRRSNNLIIGNIAISEPSDEGLRT